MDFPNHLLEATVLAALAEDLGLAGDITTNAIVAPDVSANATVVVRDPGCLAGMAVADAAFRLLDPHAKFTMHANDGDRIEANTAVATVHASTRAILSAERVALNFMQRLSGIATETSRFVHAIQGTKARIVCTRKTTPCLRAFEKYAVRVGGGVNHRFGLFDAILIKDNHIATAGGVSAAIERVRKSIGHLVKVEVEVDTLEQLEDALRHPIDAVLLDNMTEVQLREAVVMAKRASPHMICEASGGVRLDTVRAIADTGVDRISVGALTHSVQSLDIGLDF